jgi:purine-binding chemotaxis protein CheW
MSEVRRWDVLARAAAARDESVAVAEERRLLLFSLDEGSYALPVERVREISRLRPATPVPRVPDDVRGVVSMRGEIVQLIDLRRRLDLEPVDPDARSRIVVVFTDGGGVAGLLVDGVREVLRVREEDMQPPPADAQVVGALCPRGAEFVSLLDLDRLLQLEEGD